jgi:hypothetical protein
MIKELTNYPGYYADDSGKIYSSKSGRLKEIKQYPKTYGYLYVVLSKNNKKYYLRVHRLIANTFIPNPNNLPEVNHKDEDKTNNRADNLEWCNGSYNKTYGNRRTKVARKVSDPKIQRRNNTSGRKGVCKTRWGTWVAYFNCKYLGTFKTFDDAVKVRQKAEKEAYNF